MAGLLGSFDKDEVVADRAYDEAIPVETDDEVSTPPSSEDEQASPSSGGKAKAARGAPQKGRGNEGDDGSSDDESSGSTSSSDDSSTGEDDKKAKAASQGAYNPDDYKGMKVSAEVEELFQYITRYKPHTIELDTVLKPFIPELIPSIGEVDAFLKMPRPPVGGGRPEAPDPGLGTVRLDEPCLNPTDPSILDLQLRSLSKTQDLQPMEVRSIEQAEKCPKEIENWVKRIDELNRSKPAPTVQYTRRMPDIEQLMQVWPAEFEEFLQQYPLPEIADLELDLPSYIKILASVLDVPVYNQITETLHVIFTLYSEFKSNQHFSKTDNGGDFGAPDPYSFGPAPNFGNASAVGATGAVFGGPASESVAPSRAPSPVGQAGVHRGPA